MLRAALLVTWLALPVCANSPSVAAEPSAVPPVSAQAVEVSLRPKARRPVVLPEMHWGGNSDRKSWTLAVISALRGHARNIPEIVPRDIANWCPAYASASRDQREAFWAGLISALAWHESTHRPGAVGGGGLWYGLTQIYPDTARRYGCKARTGTALKDPEDNLSCALRIMAVTVERDQVVSHGMKGVAADWGPFHSRRKRTDMMEWTRSQSYCRGLARSLRPVARPPSPAPLLVQEIDPIAGLQSLRPERPVSRPTAITPVLGVESLPPPTLPVVGQRDSLPRI